MKTEYGISLALACILLSFGSCSKSINVPETIPDAQLVQIDLQSGYADELNTFNQTFKKDLIEDGTITVSFWLTASEQRSILQKARDLGFFSLPDTVHRKGGAYYFISPDPSPDSLRLKYDTQDKKVVWFYPPDTTDVNAKAISTLSDFIMQIVKAKPEYKALPEARGGYM
jgi:hypothetical protein